MTAMRLWFLARSWARNLFSVRAAAAILSAFGVLWLVVEILAFFSDGTTVPAWLRTHWWLFGLLGFLAAAIMCRPRTSIACKLSGRDVTIEIAIGDLFDFSGALVIGSNTTFDTRVSSALISEKSVQGAFTRRYYSDESQLDAELAAQLKAYAHEQLALPREGKSARYRAGTVARVNPKGRVAYLVAIADLNEHGVAGGTFEDLQVSLAELWVFVGSRGLKESLIVPVLGTGFSRLAQTREQVIREIIKSFVAACSERVFADQLTIVVRPGDVLRHQISLDELGAFLRYQCQYTEFSTPSAARVGAPA